MSVDTYGNVVNQGLLALPSTIIPPNNTSGAYQTYGDFSTVKYRWQAWADGAFGVHSVSNYKTWIYQDYNYLDVRGQKDGAYDVTVYGYFGHYDGNIGVTRGDFSNTNDFLTIRFDIISTDGGADYKFSSHALMIDGNGPVFTLSSYLKSLGYLGVYDSQRVYLKNIYVECGSDGWDEYGGVQDYGFETFILLHTNQGKYWQEYGRGEGSSFDPSMQAILDNFSYHFTTSGYQNGYREGYDYGHIVGLEEGNEEGYYSGYDDGWDIGYQFGYSDGYAFGDEEGYGEGYGEGYEEGYNLAITQNQIVEDGMFGWIMSSVESFMQFELFDGFSIGLMLSVIVGLSALIWILKVVAGG